MGYWPIVKRVLKDSDIVLLILDVRMPELSYNSEVDRLARFYRKPLVKVFTKSDLVSLDKIRELKRKYREVFFVSGKENLGLSKLKRYLLITAHKMKIDNPIIGIVGYPNVGKSALINALAKRAKARISERAGTTKNIQWIKAGSLRILDSPGVVPIEDNEVKLGVLGAKNPEKMKDSWKVAFEIIRIMLRNDKEKLESFYEINTEGKDEYEVLLDIGRSRKFLIKGGEVDENRTTVQIIRDWMKNKIR